MDDLHLQYIVLSWCMIDKTTMMISEEISIKHLLLTQVGKGLQHAIREIEAYPNEWLVWVAEKQINNSAGVLCLQITTLVQSRIGIYQSHALSTPRQPKTKKELIECLHHAVRLTQSTAQEKLHELPHGFIPALLELTGQLHFKLGQINDHRRLI